MISFTASDSDMTELSRLGDRGERVIAIEVLPLVQLLQQVEIEPSCARLNSVALVKPPLHISQADWG